MPWADNHDPIAVNFFSTIKMIDENERRRYYKPEKENEEEILTEKLKETNFFEAETKQELLEFSKLEPGMW